MVKFQNVMDLAASPDAAQDFQDYKEFMYVDLIFALRFALAVGHDQRFSM